MLLGSSFYRRVVTLISSRAFSSSSRTLTKMTKLLDKEDAVRLASNIDNFLFDCDGVLWDGRKPIEGSVETVLKLKELGKRVYYVTNNSSTSRKDYVKKCNSWGFPAEEDDIVCTAYMAAQYLKMQRFKGKVYLIGRVESLGKELEEAGIPYTGTGPDPVESTEVGGWLQTKLDPEVNCVVVGFDPHISYMKMLKAASYLKNPDCLFIGTNEDGCLPLAGDLVIPGTGCMVAPVSVATERKPIIMGKPEIGMFEVLRDLHRVDPKRSLMVGDRLETDIAFAKRCGMKSFAVLSGHSTKEEVVGGKNDIKADLYADCVGCLGKLLP